MKEDECRGWRAIPGGEGEKGFAEIVDLVAANLMQIVLVVAAITMRSSNLLSYLLIILPNNLFALKSSYRMITTLIFPCNELSEIM